MLFLLSAALWGLWIAVTIIVGYRGAPLWLGALVTFTIICLLIWMLDGPTFDDMMRRSLRLLDVGLIIAMGDGIARVTRWIDDHIGLPPPISRRGQTRTGLYPPTSRQRRVDSF